MGDIETLKKRLDDAGLDDTRLGDLIVEVEILERRLENLHALIKKAAECDDIAKACDEFADSVSSEIDKFGWEVVMERPNKPVFHDGFIMPVFLTGRELRINGVGKTATFMEFYDAKGYRITRDYRETLLREITAWAKGMTNARN